MHEATFNMDTQPGITSEPITRSMVKASIAALGIDPSAATSVTIGPDEAVTVTALLRDANGALVLPHRGPHGTAGGYLKHTYSVRVVEDIEAMTPSEYATHKAEADLATYKRVRAYIISRYGSEEAYLPNV